MKIRKFLTVRYIDDFINKTSDDKCEACANKKQKWCNRIPSDITSGF